MAGWPTGLGRKGVQAARNATHTLRVLQLIRREFSFPPPGVANGIEWNMVVNYKA